MIGLNAEMSVNDYMIFFWKRFKNAFPTILFYAVIFLLILLIFGVKYALVASTATTLFEVRYKKSFRIRDLVKMIIISLLLCTLAYAATLNAVLCILLNFTVPFLLVFFQSSQYVPKGHFGYAMTFAFLELIPLTFPQFKIQLEAVAFTSVAAAVAIVIYAALFNRRTNNHKMVRDSAAKLSEILYRLADGEDENEILHQLYEMEQTFQKMAYNSNHHLYMPDRHKYFYNMFALLIQRAVYLITDGIWAEERENEGSADAVRKLTDFTKKCVDAEDENVRQELKKEVRELTDNCTLPQGRVNIFFRSYLHMALLIIKQVDMREELNGQKYKIPWREVFRSIPSRLSTDSFEIRFALRLAVVMTITFTVSLLWDFEHTYWFPLHAFLLVQPSYEESTHRMMTRPIGTVIGCLLVHTVYPFLPGITGVYVFSVLMVAIMYCCTPGTWVQPIFSTSSAVIMASLTVDEASAVQLRVFYLIMAVILVMIVNRFFFPSKKEGQFKRNIRILIGLQRHYWAVVRQRIRGEVKPEISGEILAHFHMIYNEAMLYLKTLDDDESRDYKVIMTTLWNMFSEVEQIICMVQAGGVPPEEYGRLYYSAGAIMKRLGKDKKSKDSQEDMDIHLDGEAGMVIDGYMENMNILLSNRQLAKMTGL